MKREHFIDAAACVLIGTVVWLLYGNVVRLWWMYDDAYHIHIALEHRWVEYFANDRLWLSLTNRLFTPLLLASYDSELSLFGIDARPWYVVQLIELSVAAIFCFGVLRLWLGTALSTAGALLFVGGLPVANIVRELMLMHYIESVALIALSVLAFVISLRSSQFWLLYVSAALYLAAMLAKEIA